MTFKLDMDGDHRGTSLRGYVNVVPAELVKRFGKPKESDGYKVSGEYLFVDEDGNVFTVYDWKDTNLYDDPNAQTPAKLWGRTDSYQFHIGGCSGDFIAFGDWLKRETKGEAA